ncbi:MAG: UDP-glucose 4-epimerase [Candidatus Frackibacter sp. T328-2]|jgi:UDP-N-acetylglucosamine 4-epimerase|nr:MAG: UDP-glucose 4-epimerase [Candidatus Frackibacter sp. T328-2]
MGYKNLEFADDSVFLITGAAGFIGSNLVEAVLEMGYKVKGIDNFSNGRQENIEEFMDNDNFKFIKGDVRDYNTCSKAAEGVDYILHQAALGSVPRSMREPLIYEDNNIKGTSNMMEAARANGVKKFVYASSSSVYGDSKELPKKEGNEGQVLSPYALTKSVKEKYAKLYTEAYNLDCIGLRYFNVFGRRQDPFSEYAAVIPKFIKILKDGKQVEIYGDGEQSRDFTYIENVIEANLKACLSDSKAAGEAFNIAYGERFTINIVYDLMCEKLDLDREPIYASERPGDIKHSLADISKAKDLLDYDPDWDFKSGFEEAIEWYKDNL